MLIYFLLFTGIGFFVGRYAKSPKKGVILLLGISFVWMLGSGPFWGLITLGELLCGFSIYKFFVEQAKDE